jgi:hypothetical protein
MYPFYPLLSHNLIIIFGSLLAVYCLEKACIGNIEREIEECAINRWRDSNRCKIIDVSK